MKGWVYGPPGRPRSRVDNTKSFNFIELHRIQFFCFPAIESVSRPWRRLQLVEMCMYSKYFMGKKWTAMKWNFGTSIIFGRITISIDLQNNNKISIGQCPSRLTCVINYNLMTSICVLKPNRKLATRSSTLVAHDQSTPAIISHWLDRWSLECITAISLALGPPWPYMQGKWKCEDRIPNGRMMRPVRTWALDLFHCECNGSEPAGCIIIILIIIIKRLNAHIQ